MHIPDGFLDAKTAATTGVLAIGGVTLAVRQLRRQLPPQRVPLLGLAAAFVFAAQMLNFPVVGGTSGHLVGSALIAVLLGPGAAVLVLAAVLIVQCFVFADGGLLALGANIFNMGSSRWRRRLRDLPRRATTLWRHARRRDGGGLRVLVRHGVGRSFLRRRIGVVGNGGVVGGLSSDGERAHPDRPRRSVDHFPRRDHDSPHAAGIDRAINGRQPVHWDTDKSWAMAC